VLGVICAGVGIAIMRLVALAEAGVRRTGISAPIRPILGGFLLAGLALLSPQVLSSGHGALHADLAVGLGLAALATVFVLKSCASIVALGLGFRGGLFFASLFLGSLLGQMFAVLTQLSGLPVPLARENAALVGMGALAVAVVGGPLTMSFLVLETTQDFGVAAATLAASLVASTIVRERFGYSLSTWRMHLRGETIRSARDVGWMRALTAGRLMRTDIATLADTATVAEFRRRFPLGSRSRAALVDQGQRYAGLVFAVDVYRPDVDEAKPLADLAHNRDVWLTPELNIQKVMATFDRTETEDLVVLDDQGAVLGLLSELYVARRYAKELDRIQQGLFGEG
jgi:CIC family chloride channel protein